jgi:hypothetical protein
MSLAEAPSELTYKIQVDSLTEEELEQQKFERQEDARDSCAIKFCTVVSAIIFTVLNSVVTGFLVYNFKEINNVCVQLWVGFNMACYAYFLTVPYSIECYYKKRTPTNVKDMLSKVGGIMMTVMFVFGLIAIISAYSVSSTNYHSYIIMSWIASFFSQVAIYMSQVEKLDN